LEYVGHAIAFKASPRNEPTAKGSFRPVSNRPCLRAAINQRRFCHGSP
jgi:hypothetical protein